MDKNNPKEKDDKPGIGQQGITELPDEDTRKKKEDYLRNGGKIEDYPDQDEVPGTSVAPDNDSEQA